MADAIPALALAATLTLIGVWQHGWLRGYEHRKRHEAEMRELSASPQPRSDKERG